MDQQNKLVYMGNEVILEKIISESSEQFNQRLKYIMNMENKKIDWKEAVRLSKIWHCINFLNCKYQPDIHYMVSKYDK